MKYFSGRLRELRGDAPQSAFAKKFGVSQVTWGRWELGQREPDLDTIHKICETESVSADWLLGLTDDRTPGTDRAPIRKGLELGKDNASAIVAKVVESKTPIGRKALSVVAQRYELSANGALVHRITVKAPDGTRREIVIPHPEATLSPLTAKGAEPHLVRVRVPRYHAKKTKTTSKLAKA